MIAEWLGAAGVLGSILLYPRSVPWGALVGALGCGCWLYVAVVTSLDGLLVLQLAILAAHGSNVWRGT